MNKQPIIVEAVINAPIERVWQFYSEPEHITKWAFADETWHAPHAENDLREGGKFKTVMAAKNGSSKFDFSGTYTKVVEYKLIEYVMDGNDGAEGKPRIVKVEFESIPDGVKVTTTFDPEQTNTQELQFAGWQAILNNFKKYAESISKAGF